MFAKIRSKGPARVLFLVLVLAVCMGAGPCVTVESQPGSGELPPPGVTPPDRTLTCDQFDDFNRICTPTCGVTWDCDLAYDSLSYYDQVGLDVCSDCLAANLAEGFCADCEIPSEGIDSCQYFMETLLGVDCW